MNARTALPLSKVIALLSMSLAVTVADVPAPSESGPPAHTTATLPDNEAQAKARAALYADEAAATPVKTNPQPAAAEPERSADPAPVDEPAAQPTPTLIAVSTAAGPLPDTEAQAKARAALYTDDPQLVAIAVEQATPQALWTPAQASATASPLTQGMSAPALPTNATQQAQLAALLQQYRTDAISASDYHARRAEILAGK